MCRILGESEGSAICSRHLTERNSFVFSIGSTMGSVSLLFFRARFDFVQIL